MSLFAVDATKVARANEFYTTNHMGEAMCKLCNCVCHTAEKFLNHVDGNRHQKMLARVAREKEYKARLEAEARNARDAQKMVASGKTLNVVSGLDQKPQHATPYGRPTFRYRVESDPTVHECKVWFEINFPNVPEGSRPLYRWLSTWEQLVEPSDASVVYLVVAAEGYESISFKFPAKLQRRAGGDVPGEMAHWDNSAKKYSLFFIVG